MTTEVFSLSLRVCGWISSNIREIIILKPQHFGFPSIKELQSERRKQKARDRKARQRQRQRDAVASKSVTVTPPKPNQIVLSGKDLSAEVRDSHAFWRNCRLKKYRAFSLISSQSVATSPPKVSIFNTLLTRRVLQMLKS